MIPTSHPSLPGVDKAKPTKRQRQGGFSLIEVTMAFGICATGLLLTIALLPTILSQLGEAADRNAYARIKQSLSARYAMMDWGLLEEDARSGAAERFYFDFSGTEVESDSFEAVYAAEAQVGNRRTLAGDDNYNRFIRSLEIKVTQRIQHDDAFTDPKNYDTLTASLGNEARLEDKYRD